MICNCGGELKSYDQVHLPNNKTMRKRKCKKCGEFVYTIEHEIEYTDKAKYKWNLNHRKNKKSRGE